jgi:hypothetical protein
MTSLDGVEAMTCVPEKIRAQEEVDRAALVNQFGRYTLTDLSTGRVLLEPDDGDIHVLYLVGQQLVIDNLLHIDEVKEVLRARS